MPTGPAATTSSYVHTDIPDGMAIREWRAQRAAARAIERMAAARGAPQAAADGCWRWTLGAAPGRRGARIRGGEAQRMSRRALAVAVVVRWSLRRESR